MSMSLWLVAGSGFAPAAMGVEWPGGVALLAGAGAALSLVAVLKEGGEAKGVKAGKQTDAKGVPKVFTLSVGSETITLEPGRTWMHVDAFKWVTRGLIEAPQSFHVLPNGTVELNSEKISLQDADGPARLEQEMNKRHVPTAPLKAPAAPSGMAAGAGAAPAPGPTKAHFKVKLDHLGHLLIECTRGQERAETGLRGLTSLIQNGLMLQPKAMHVDALQRAIEIDGVRFECSEAGAQQLEEALNAHYAPTLQRGHENDIEIKENPAAATGYDIRFVTVRAGARVEVKGHLSQEKLDILQDPAKSDLLQHGILLRLSPPNLLIRRRRPDGGEERVPEFQDIHYRRVTALQLQEILNHPLIRRNTGQAGARAASDGREGRPPEFARICVVRNPANKQLLWLECWADHAGGEPEGKAFTHHNLADLQHAGVFRPHLDVALSLEGGKLSVLDKATGAEETLRIEAQSPDEDLARASQMLSAALKPPSPRPPPPSAEVATLPAVPSVETLSPAALPQPQPAPVQALAPAPGESPAPPKPPPRRGETIPHAAPDPVGDASAAPIAAPPRRGEAAGSAPGSPKAPPRVGDASRPPGLEEPPLDPATRARFSVTDPLRVNLEVFERLRRRVGGTYLDVRLSLPRVFENRRFEVISFSLPEITSVLELRCEAFSGFYLSHINERKVLLVYSRDGKHIEWGPEKCELQPAFNAETNEFRGSALLGMGRDRRGEFVFIVSPEYKRWAQAFEKLYVEVSVRFVTVREFAAAPEEYELFWPEPA